MSIKGRFNRANIIAHMTELLGAAAKEYRDATGRDIDPGNGTAQIPKRGDYDATVRASTAYARHRLLRDLINDVTP